MATAAPARACWRRCSAPRRRSASHGSTSRRLAQIRSLAVLCEDDLAELHRRQEAINRLYGCRFGDLDQVRWLPRLGYDNLLMSFDRNGRGVLTPFFEQVRQAALELQAQLLIVDTAADVFGGNENHPVAGSAIHSGGARPSRARAERRRAALRAPVGGRPDQRHRHRRVDWLVQHRSLAASTSSRPKPDSDEEESAAPDDSRRILTRKKANMASTGDSVELRWENGVFVTVGERINSFTAGPIGGMVRARAERVFLLLLDARHGRGPVRHRRAEQPLLRPPRCSRSDPSAKACVAATSPQRWSACSPAARSAWRPSRTATVSWRKRIERSPDSAGTMSQLR